MGEPAPWGSWDSFSDFGSSSAQVGFNDSPVINVEAPSQTKSVISNFASGESSSCTSCNQNSNTYEPQKSIENVNKSGKTHHPFPPKEEEEKPLESVGFLVTSQLRGIGNEIVHLEDLAKSSNSQKRFHPLHMMLKKQSHNYH